MGTMSAFHENQDQKDQSNNLSTSSFSSGFTLIELSLVIVIIGILLGSIMKGQEMIKNARIKRFYSEARTLSEAIYTYYDKYSFYPGDDPQSYAKWPSLTASANGDGNGLISTTGSTGAQVAYFTCTSAGTREQCNLWGVLRQAGLLTGSGYINPVHAFGSAIAVTYYNLGAWTTTNALLTHWIVYQSIASDICQAIDLQYDDGNWQTGNIRSSAAYTTSGNLTLYLRL